MERRALDSSVALAQVERHARALGWHEEARHDGDPSHAFEIVWSSPNGRSRLHFVAHGLAGCNFVAFDGDDAPHLAGEFASQMPCIDLIEAQRLAASRADTDRAIEAVKAIGVLAPTAYDGDVMQSLSAAMLSPDPRMRRHALTAMAVLGWPDLRVLVAAAADTEDDADVKDHARAVLAAFDAASAARRRSGGA